jgi:hypothetical protein
VHGRRLVVTWTGLRGAADYLVTVETSAGEIATERTGGARNAVFFIPRHERVRRVTVTTTSRIGRGRPVRAAEA